MTEPKTIIDVFTVRKLDKLRDTILKRPSTYATNEEWEEYRHELYIIIQWLICEVEHASAAITKNDIKHMLEEEVKKFNR